MKAVNQTVFEIPEEFRAGARAHIGNVLHVDLGSRELWIERPPEERYRKLLGGRGFILHYLLEEMPAGADPLGPDNLLVFAPGVLSGTILPGTGRHGVGGKSPLTGVLASGEAGGWWGHELKRAGLDAVVFRGRSETPVYLWVEEGQAELRKAGHLWGKSTGDTQALIREELEDDRIRVAGIGIGGENLVRFAAVMHDINRAAGRSGLGAVMGSKRLKAVAVRGKSRVGLADRSALKAALDWITSSYKKEMKWAVDYGTPGALGFNHDAGTLANRNYRDGALEGIDDLRHEHFFPELVVERDTCSGCPVRCKIVVENQKPPIQRRYGGPEYESLGGLGALCAVSDPEAVAKANELCAKYGLDTISTGATIAFAMDCSEHGLVDQGDYRPRFGSGEDLIKGVNLIANREGFGGLMAEGSARLAEELGPGAADYLAVVRKQELPLHDPRYKHTTGLGYALSPTGADHMHNLMDNFANMAESDICARLEEVGLETPLPLFGITDRKVKAYYYETAFKHVMDSALVCHFYPYRFHHLVEALRAAEGWSDFSVDELVEIGTRIAVMGRMFLIREGSTHQEDRISEHPLKPLDQGPIAGKTIAPEEFAAGLQTYFELMGWDQHGVPQGPSLDRLGLEGYPFGV
mgnify:CR=1 FL=1